MIKPLKIIRTEDPVKEIWSMLSYFESEHNSNDYLENKFGSSIENLSDTARNLAFTIRAGREYYQAAESVSILTHPLLLFYGMTALSKALFIATYARKSPSRGHGLKEVERWNGILSEFSVKVRKDGAFPQFHCCFSKETLENTDFSMKGLLSLIPEIKPHFEALYGEKSRALKILRDRCGIYIVDTELDKYEDLEDLIRQIPGIHERYHKEYQKLDNRILLWCTNSEAEDPVVCTISGEEYLVLPIKKQTKTIVVPQISAHFLIMYLVGMLSRYHLKEWGEIIKGEQSGEIYIVQKFFEVTKRKFPNLILNELQDSDFFFTGPKIETETDKKLDKEQLEDIYKYVNERFAREWRGI